MRATFYLLCLLLVCACTHDAPQEEKDPAVLIPPQTKVRAEVDGQVFRDLNGNGKLDIYEDSRQAIEARIDDLIAQMTLEEKAGSMFIEGAPVNEDGSLERNPELARGPGARRPAAKDNIDQNHLTHFNVWEIPADPNMMAVWYNKLQQHAEQTRLGIPITIASDPRHHFSKSIFAMAAQGFTQFCETLGLAAIGSDSLVEAFANIVREEYLAVGIRESLHPQIDLATEPRWPRINGAFGEDAELTARMVTAYLKGMQGNALSASSIACMTKHFPGGGPQNEGLDPHFEFQKGQVYPGDNFD
ncbi:MAG: glycoside hydrolase family 3 protein, partial [Phaeodactylibacter sp.]|nr:glycoside hydrolase family 3 protein [Phaeodactylibacter sp.]